MSRSSGEKTTPPAATVALLFAGFIYTGAMTVLLGLMLPRIAAMHRLTDIRSGALLVVQAASSATGALFVRRRYGRTLTIGYLLMAAGSAALPVASASSAAVLSIGAFGLGLGMAMTSTSIVVGRLFSASRGTALSLLNFSWSAGAAVCPLIIARVSGHFSSTEICIPVAVFAALLAAALGPLTIRSAPPLPATASAAAEISFTPLLLFSAIGFLYVGAESALGGWMSTWANRAVSWNFEKSNLAAGCFWGAILLGRAATPLLLRALSEKRLNLISIVAAAIGTMLLIAAHNPATLVIAACWTGLALAPIYPLTIALFLERAGESRNTGWVFAAAGYGGALFPGLTGLVSTGAHSLRTGLLIPLAATTAMLPIMIGLSGAPRPAPDAAPRP